MMKFVVTGGAGFIGSHLVDHLISKGHEVTVLDDLSTGHKKNIHPQAKFKQGSVLDRKLVESLLLDSDGCFHLAAVASVARCNTDWLNSHEINLNGTLNVFHAALASKRKVPVVYASSAAVYGNATQLPLEESSQTKPLGFYGLDKLHSEKYAQALGQISALKTFGLRFFNVFGSRQDPRSEYSGVISRFIRFVKEEEDILVYGDGQQERDFVHVQDVVEFALEALTHASEEGPLSNICTGKGTQIIELAQLISKKVHSSIHPRINHGPKRSGEILKSIGSTQKMMRTFGHLPKRTLENNLPLEEST